MPQHHELTIAEASALIRENRLSPVTLMESLLSRSASLDPALSVWSTLDPNAALNAAHLSKQHLKQNGPIGQLHGIPVGIKDIYYTEGVRTSAGSPIHANLIPTYDAHLVALLKRAGAIIMGKTVTTEFACADPPPTRNPWNTGHTPGGSSSGSAVGVAAHIFPTALGSQTAGSILRPASYNGIVGLKPTYGRVSKRGVIPVAWSLDTMGCFTRTVEDAAIMLNVLAGYDPKDPSSSSMPTSDYHKNIGLIQSAPRIALIRNFFYDRSEPEIQDHTDNVLQQLSQSGAIIQEVSITDDFDTLISAHRIIMNAEAATVHLTNFNTRPDDYGPKIRAMIESGRLIPSTTYIQAQRFRRKFYRGLAKILKEFDCILTPSTTSPAPKDLTTTGDPILQTPWTTVGLPSITIPSGISKTGLPLGIQLAAGPFCEEALISVGIWCEQALDVTLTPPTI